MEHYEAKVTAIMREADQLFQKTGGSTRHYVRDLLLPMMEQAGLKIVDAQPSPAQPPVNGEGESEEYTANEAKKCGELIDKHIGGMGQLEKASVQYFIDKGAINGNFRLRLLAMMQFYRWHITRQYSTPPASPAKAEQEGRKWFSNWELKMEQEPKREQERLKWVNGAPGIRKEYHAKVKSKLNPAITLDGMISPAKASDKYWWATGADFNYTIENHEIVAYLSESTPATQPDPVAFAEWVGATYQSNGDGSWYDNSGNPWTTQELYALFLQQTTQE